MENIPELPLQIQTAGQVWLVGHGVREQRVFLSWSLGPTAGRHVLLLSPPHSSMLALVLEEGQNQTRFCNVMPRVSWLSVSKRNTDHFQETPASVVAVRRPPDCWGCCGFPLSI